MRWIYLLLFFGPNLYGQFLLEGRVIDAKRGLPIANVVIRDSVNGALEAISDLKGLFKIDISGPALKLQTLSPPSDTDPIDLLMGRRGTKILTLTAQHDNYQTQIIPVDLVLINAPLIIALQWQVQDQLEEELSSGVSEYDEFMDQAIISAPLNAYGDPVTQAEQFDFGAVFYSPMGADRHQRGLVFQGMNLQDPASGLIQWNMLGGLNQAMRYRKNQNEFNPENEGFGQLGGTTYVGIRPSEFNPGTRLKTQVGNRSYQWGYSVQHVVPQRNGWSALALVSARDGLSGLTMGNSYNAWGGLISVEKQLVSGMSLGLMAAYTPVNRGMTAPLTREVLNLKGHQYNPNWGWQNNNWRSARERFSRMPLAVMSLYSPQQSSINWVFQLGTIAGVSGQSRLNYSSGANPLGNHYTKMPSYFLGQDQPTTYDYYRALVAQQTFQSDGQIAWPELYAANRLRPEGDSQYLIQKERSRLREYQARWNFNWVMNKAQGLSLALSGRWNEQRRFTEIVDLLGGTYYLDRNNFYSGIDPSGQWNNLDSMGKPLVVGDRIDYDYSLHALILNGFGQYHHALKQGQLVMGLGYSRADSRRVGHMRHGLFPQKGASYGRSAVQSYSAFKAKIHWAHYWSPKLSSAISAVFDQQLPLLEQTFVYSRYHNARTSIGRPAQLTGLFGQLRYQSLGIDLVVKPFIHYQQYTRQNGFFYSDHVRGALGQSGLVQQHLWDLDQLGLGFRSGLKFLMGERLTWTAVHVWSHHVYAGAAKLFLAGNNLIDTEDGGGASISSDTPYQFVISDLERLGSRRTFLEGFKPSTGPQQVLHATLTYRDPSFWWLGLGIAHFSNRYVGLSALRRSEDAFFQNANQLGLSIEDHDLSTLWAQEQLPPITLTSLKMGVSWRLNESYLSVFGSVQNLFNRSFVSGGFESSRKVYIPDLAQDQGRPFGALFGNKYFPGIGRSYYLTCSINF